MINIPFQIGESGWVSKAFCKWITVNLEFGDLKWEKKREEKRKVAIIKINEIDLIKYGAWVYRMIFCLTVAVKLLNTSIRHCSTDRSFEKQI